MRGLLIASAGFAMVGGGAADAQQRPGASYGMPGAVMQAPMTHPQRPSPIAARPPVVQTSSRQVTPRRQPRWGSKIGGRWWAGANAPGGWAGYRRPHRGWAVPGYWNAPRFAVGDWASYGLPQPPQGYNWVRYYDDAVLIDPRGSVYDTVGDVDWDRDDSGSAVTIDPLDYAANDAVYAGPGERGYAPPYDDRRAPRPDDRRAPRLDDRRAPPPLRSGYGADYPPPPAYADTYAPARGYAPPPRADADGYATPDGARYQPPRAYAVAPGSTWVSPDGATTVTTTSGPAYAAGATTVVVQSVPVTTTTTTTEYYETSPYPRRKLRRR